VKHKIFIIILGFWLLTKSKLSGNILKNLISDKPFLFIFSHKWGKEKQLHIFFFFGGENNSKLSKKLKNILPHINLGYLVWEFFFKPVFQFLPVLKTCHHLNLNISWVQCFICVKIANYFENLFSFLVSNSMIVFVKFEMFFGHIWTFGI